MNTAPNDLYPAEFADRASAAAGEAGLAVEVLDEKALAKGGYGGILGRRRRLRPGRRGWSGSATPRPGRRRRSPWSARASPSTPAASPSSRAAKMDQMTSDMSGAAAVVATVLVAAAELGLPVTVTAYAALAENMPSGHRLPPRRRAAALRRRDREGQGAPAGKTVHVLNTDAEGRLVLADAIVRACEDEPDYLLETSTLTGAQVVALGKRTMGVMGTPELRDRVAELAREVGEGGWAMPLPEHLREGLDSPLADLQNIAGEPVRRDAGRRPLPGRVRRRRGAVGPPGRRRSGVQRRKALRLHRSRRYRRAGPDAAGHPGRHRRAEARRTWRRRPEQPAAQRPVRVRRREAGRSRPR